MRHIYAITLLIALIMPIRLCRAQEVSAFYTLPQGSFVGTITEEGIVDTESSVYIPYSDKGHTWTSIAPQTTGQWKITGREDIMGGYYPSTDPMNSTYTIPQLVERGKISYQYGGLEKGVPGTSNKAYVGDSVSHYMTPARLVCDHTQIVEGKSVSTLVRTSSYDTKEFDTIGVYFNNIDVMYIEGIRIPITSNTKGDTKDNLFPQQDSHIKVTIYPAKGIGGKEENIADRSKILSEVTLTKDSFTANNQNSFTGAVQGEFPTPIAIRGAFVVELTEMKKSGCKFFVTASRERENENYWGYHIEGNKETYHSKFTPAICVKAMFPALYPQIEEAKEIVIPAEGVTTDNAPRRTIYANKRYTKNEFSCTTAEWCKVEAVKTTKDHVTFAFTAEANKTDEVREAEVVFRYRGKEVMYNLYQPAMDWTSVREGLTKGDLGTICLPYEVEAFKGASLWEIAYWNGEELVLEESEKMESGMPYVFVAEGEEFRVGESGEFRGESLAKNGLHGTLETIRDEALEGKYVMANNEFVKCGSGCELGANRAYMVLEEVPTTATPAKEGVRRMALECSVESGELKVESVEWRGIPQKVYDDGKVYIKINGGAMNYLGIYSSLKHL